MKLSKRDVNLLLTFCGILLVVVTYFFIFTKLQEKTEEVEAENERLQVAVTKLENLRSNREFYETETERYKQENAEMKNVYPSAILNADKILYAKKLEDRFGLFVSYLGMNTAETVDVVYPTVDVVSVDDELRGEVTPPAPSNPNGIYLYRHGLEMNIDTGYSGIKNALQYIVNDPEQKSIHALTLTFNENTGVLSGTMSLSMYSMTGTKVVYRRPDFTGISIGTEDIFRTFDVKEPQEPEEDLEENVDE